MTFETQTHLTVLRELLVSQCTELQADLHAARMARAQLLCDVPSTEVGDRKDAAAADQLAEASDSSQQRMRSELASCEAALRRLEEERYGACVDCAKPIPWPRLLAQPAAVRCASCQRGLERSGQARART